MAEFVLEVAEVYSDGYVIGKTGEVGVLVVALWSENGLTIYRHDSSISIEKIRELLPDTYLFSRYRIYDVMERIPPV